MSDKHKTVIVGLPIIRKLLAGEDVELPSLGVTLIPDDVLWNDRKRSDWVKAGCPEEQQK